MAKLKGRSGKLRMEITGFKTLLKMFDHITEQYYKVKDTAVVGYSAPYAVYVHEGIAWQGSEARKYTTEGTGPKYLEKPARDSGVQKRIALATFQALSNGNTLQVALTFGGKVLLEASQKICPMETGTLRESGYVRPGD